MFWPSLRALGARLPIVQRLGWRGLGWYERLRTQCYRLSAIGFTAASAGFHRIDDSFVGRGMLKRERESEDKKVLQSRLDRSRRDAMEERLLDDDAAE